MLSKCLFKLAITKINFTTTIDLFASRTNKQLPTYVSYKLDPEVILVDSFSLSWKIVSFYCFNPRSCISRYIQKIMKDRGIGIMFIPQWPDNSLL